MLSKMKVKNFFNHIHLAKHDFIHLLQTFIIDDLEQ